jgi:hypothetical protein
MSLAFLGKLIQYSYWPSLLMLLFGIVGNVFLFLKYSRLRKLSITLYFRVGALIDLFITINWLKIFLREKYNIFLTHISSFMCKTVQFSIITAGPISSWIHVVIAFDRLLNIVYNRTRYSSFLSSSTFQISALALVFTGNMGYFFFILSDMDLMVDFSQINDTNNSSTSIDAIYNCNFMASSEVDLLYWLEMANVLVSFALMTITSVLTIVFLVRSRQRLLRSSSTIRARRSQIRDVKFAVTSITLNFFYLLTNAPIPFYQLVVINLVRNIESDLDNFLRTLAIFLWYMYYVFNFYLQLMVNSLVRAEFFKLLVRPNSSSRTRKRDCRVNKKKPCSNADISTIRFN